MLNDANVPDCEATNAADNSPPNGALSCIKAIKQSGLTPIHRLPNELLSEIFLWHLQSIIDDSEVDNAIMALDQVISLVCRLWRAVAHGEPRLWTHIVATNPAIIKSYTQRYMPLSHSGQGQARWTFRRV